MEKSLNWNPVKADDGKALYSYALYLRGCYNTMQDLEYMEELNLPFNLKLNVSKLPYNLRERWRSSAFDVLERSKHRAKFCYHVTFMERQARVMQDPLFGNN